jgi:hypothetical protein
MHHAQARASNFGLPKQLRNFVLLRSFQTVDLRCLHPRNLDMAIFAPAETPNEGKADSR